MIASAYEYSPARIVFSAPVPSNRFDYLATVPNAREALRFKIQVELNLIGRTETRVTDCFLLRARSENISTLKPAKDANNFVGTFSSGAVKANAYSTVDWSLELENILGQPVINQTKLEGRFDIQFSWDPNNKSVDSINAALRNQLGLELVSSREPIEILVVEKAR